MCDCQHFLLDKQCAGGCITCGMDKKPLTDWLYRWIGEVEARPNSLYWFVDTKWETGQRLVVLFPFSLLASGYCLCRKFLVWAEHYLYVKGRRHKNVHKYSESCVLSKWYSGPTKDC